MQHAESKRYTDRADDEVAGSLAVLGELLVQLNGELVVSSRQTEQMRPGRPAGFLLTGCDCA